MSDEQQPADGTPETAVPAAKPRGSRVQKRSAARRKALQALYQWDMAGGTVGTIIEQFRESQPDMHEIEHAYFEELVHGVPEQLSQIDNHLQPHLDRPMEQLDPIERCILRVGIFELVNRQDVPYRVVINESVELAKQFGAEDGHKYVNGVLDKLAGHLRYAETAAARRKGK